MRRSGPCRAFREVFRQSWLIALTVAVGCAHLDSNLSDRLARRALPVEVEAERETSPPQENAHVRGTSDANVKPAVAVPPVQGSGAGTPNDRSSALPPALVGPPRRQDSDRAHPTAISLPNDSDEASLDEIAATGKPLTLPEAIKLAFRYQPRLRCSARDIAQARGLQQIAFSTFLPLVAANYDVGEYSLGVGGPRSASRRARRDSISYRAGSLPFGLNVGTNFELAELKVQWLLLDFGRRLGRYEQADWRTTSLSSRPTAPTKRWPTKSRSHTTMFCGARPCGAPPRMPFAAPTRSSRRSQTRARGRGRARSRAAVRSAAGGDPSGSSMPPPRLEFVALAGLNLAIGLKCNEPVRVVEPPEIPPLALSLADCLETAVRERREFYVVQRTVEIAVQGGRVARADFAPKVIADGTLLDFLQQHLNGRADFRWGSSGSTGRSSRAVGGSPRRAWRTPRCARPWHRPSRSPIISHSRSMRPTAAPSRPGSASTMPARRWIRPARIIRLVQLRLREGAATPTEIADAQASLTRAAQNYLNARYNYLIAMIAWNMPWESARRRCTQALTASLSRTRASRSLRSNP